MRPKCLSSFLNKFASASFHQKINSLAPCTYQEFQKWLDINQSTINEFAIDEINWRYTKDEDVLISFSNNIISKTKRDYLDLTLDAILLPSPPIPILYFYKYKENVIKSTPQIKDYLIRFFREKSSLFKNTNELINSLNEFCKTNKSKLDSIEKMFKKSPEFLGAGDSGIAFDIGDNKVLKLFDHQFVYNKALEAYNRLFDNPELSKTEALIYDVGTIGNIITNNTSTPVYYYIMEKMKPIRDVIPNTYPLVSLLRFIDSQIPSYPPLKEIQSGKLKLSDNNLNELISTISQNIKNSIPDNTFERLQDVKDVTPSLKSDWLNLLIKEVLFKYITNRLDLHMGNLGLTPYGELRYFDPAHEGATSDNMNV